MTDDDVSGASTPEAGGLPEWASLPRVADAWDVVRRQARRAAHTLWDQASEWLGLKPPRPRPRRWIDRTEQEPVCPRELVGRTDAVTGETIKATDHVYMCRNCEAAFLAANWREISRRNSGTCPVCGMRGGVKG